jgi:hypothetical protein
MSEAQLTGWPFAIEKAARAAIPAGATPAAVVAVLLAQAKEFLWADQFRPAASDDPIRSDLVAVTRMLTATLTDLAGNLERKAAVTP